MKKFLMLSVAAVIITAVTASAQTTKKEAKYDLKMEKKELRKEKKELRKLEGKDVSYQSKAAFNVDFRNVSNPVWKRGTYYDEVTFTNRQGKKMTAYYDYDAELVGTTMHKNFSELPASAQKYINGKYSGYITEDIVFFKDNQENETEMILFGDEFDHVDNYFVELKKGKEEIILRADPVGNVSFFKKMQRS